MCALGMGDVCVEIGSVVCVFACTCVSMRVCVCVCVCMYMVVRDIWVCVL